MCDKFLAYSLLAAYLNNNKIRNFSKDRNYTARWHAREFDTLRLFYSS